MIIANFDGRNVHTIFDAVEYKALIGILKQVSVTQANAVAKEMGQSGFDVSPSEVQQLSKAAHAVSKKLLTAITVVNRAENESMIGADEDLDDSEDDTPTPPKPQWKM